MPNKRTKGKKICKISTEGQITWVDDQCVGYKCECGEDEIVIDVSGVEKCKRCGRIYMLEQVTEVFELLQD